MTLIVPPGVTDQSPWETATFTKPDVTVAGSSGAWTTANSPITIFTVSGGRVLLRCYGVCTASFTSTGATGTLTLGDTILATRYTTTVTANGTNLASGHVFGGVATTAFAVALTNSVPWQILANAGESIVLTIATNNMTAGGMKLYCEWIPLDAGATVTAATP